MSSQPTHSTKQFETTLTVITHSETGTDQIDPIRAKALLTEFTVTHENDHTYTITDGRNTYTTDTAQQNCSCPSTLPDRNQQCEHLKHIHERQKQDELPTSNDQTNEKNENSTNPALETLTTKSPSLTNSTTCNACEKPIGSPKTISTQIRFATCNTCALQNHNIYYLETETGDRELVYFNDILTNTTADQYYHNDTAISAYEFFANHTETQPDDAVIIVHRRTQDSDCSGLIFETDTVAVPKSTLTKARKTLLDTTDNETTHRNNQTKQSTQSPIKKNSETPQEPIHQPVHQQADD